MCLLAATVSVAQQPRMNVLFIAVDDLRPQLGCYGDPTVKSPCIDRLARNGLVFNRAYCQQAVCSPSRTSLLTGLRPDTTRIYDLNTHFRKTVPNAVTLPEHFKNHGYHTQGLGKIYHADLNDPQSWSVPYWMPKAGFPIYATEENLLLVKMKTKQMRIKGEPRTDEILEEDPKTHATLKIKRRQRALGRAWEIAEVPDNALPDGKIADQAIEVMGTLKDKPFFLAVGFWKPHAQFNAPKQYWDLYQRDQLPPLDAFRPSGAPDIAFHESTEVLGPVKNQQTPTAAQAAEMRHGYFANISYMDAQVGKVLNALTASGVADRTVVIFFSDHGYHVGEHTLWGKTSTFELDARVPLLIHAPGVSAAGQRTSSLAELVDLFPTLVDLCGLPQPQGLEGVSQTPVLRDPTQSVKSAAFSQHPRPNYYDRTPSRRPTAMGVSVRTAAGRYTEWRDWSTGATLARELYLAADEPHETRSVVDDPSAAAIQRAAERLLAEKFPITPHPE